VRLRREPRPRVERILVGTDRSETAELAVRWAVDMADRYDAELVVLQVARDEDPAVVEQELHSYVDKLRAPARPLVRSGADPARVIVDAARDERIDVVVVGSVGMTGRKEFLLDNIPNRVSHNAPCTVVIVQTNERRR
jgi:ubiquinone biosynthesis protein